MKWAVRGSQSQVSGWLGARWLAPQQHILHISSRIAENCSPVSLSIVFDRFNSGGAVVHPASTLSHSVQTAADSINQEPIRLSTTLPNDRNMNLVHRAFAYLI